MGKSDLGLSDIIDKIKKEFIQLEKKSDKKGKYQFDFNDIEVEISFLAKKVGKAGVNIVVAQLGGEYSSEQVHKIKFNITPYRMFDDTSEDMPESPEKYQKWWDDNGYGSRRKMKASAKKGTRRKTRRGKVSAKRAARK